METLGTPLSSVLITAPAAPSGPGCRVRFWLIYSGFGTAPNTTPTEQAQNHPQAFLIDRGTPWKTSPGLLCHNTIGRSIGEQRPPMGLAYPSTPTWLPLLPLLHLINTSIISTATPGFSHLNINVKCRLKCLLNLEPCCSASLFDPCLTPCVLRLMLMGAHADYVNVNMQMISR